MATCIAHWFAFRCSWRLEKNNCSKYKKEMKITKNCQFLHENGDYQFHSVLPNSRAGLLNWRRARAPCGACGQLEWRATVAATKQKTERKKENIYFRIKYSAKSRSCSRIWAPNSCLTNRKKRWIFRFLPFYTNLNLRSEQQLAYDGIPNLTLPISGNILFLFAWFSLYFDISRGYCTQKTTYKYMPPV